MHKLLQRQLRRFFGRPDDVPSSLVPFVQAVNEVYHQADEDRRFLERTMDNASRELMTRQQRLEEALARSRETEKQLAHQALHDSLTGLPNRVLFHDRIEHALTRSPRQNSQVAVLFIDLDDFKNVNDTFGHAVGDKLLCATADRLRPMVRTSDTCARLGGDEFAIVLEDTNSTESAKAVAERVLTALRSTFTLDEQQVFVGASVGIAMANQGESAEELMRNADLAMYMAKTGGKHRAVVFESSMHASVVQRMELELELRGAVERGEFVLNFQPIVALDSGRIAGLEALVRWQHPTRGLVSPADFIPIAEQSGVIIELGRWVLEEACRECVSWERHSAAAAGVSVTVNISGRELREASIVGHVRDALANSGLPAHRLILEVTESTLVGNDTPTIERLRALKALGVLVAIDDFGTGYSSLSYLQQFPVDIIKIDKSFIDHLGISGEESPLSRAVVSLGGALSLRTVAEGVETEGQHERLRELGCPYGQGYLFSRPLAAASVDDFLGTAVRSTRSLREPLRRLTAHGLPQEGSSESAAAESEQRSDSEAEGVAATL